MSKKIVVGVTGGIAAYKAISLVSLLKKSGHDVKVILSRDAQKFVTPFTFEVISNNSVSTDETLWKDYEVEHIKLAKAADVIVITPTTANTIAKLAQGIADGIISTTLLAATCKIILTPSMNTNMYHNKIVQKNIDKLRKTGQYIILEPESGKLACGDIGKGRLVDINVIKEEIEKTLSKKTILKDKNILISLGGTSENIDSVRYITNRSSGKMGLALARESYRRGANVSLVVGNVSVPISQVFKDITRVTTTEEMKSAMVDKFKKSDIAILSAAPGDYKVEKTELKKIKSKEVNLHLIKNPDIAMELSKIKKDQKIVIFSAESDDIIENSSQKLARKKADFVVANDISSKESGFDCDTNKAYIIDSKEIIDYPLMSKDDLAKVILDRLECEYS